MLGGELYLAVFALRIAAAHLLPFTFLYNIFSIEGRNECHLAYNE